MGISLLYIIIVCWNFWTDKCFPQTIIGDLLAFAQKDRPLKHLFPNSVFICFANLCLHLQAIFLEGWTFVLFVYLSDADAFEAVCEMMLFIICITGSTPLLLRNGSGNLASCRYWNIFKNLQAFYIGRATENVSIMNIYGNGRRFD